MSQARAVFVEVMRDVVALCKFRERQLLQRGVWEAQVPLDVRERLILAEYVVVQKHIVYLTCDGLEVIGYTEAMA